MAVTRIKNSGIKTGTLKYDSALGGYPPVMAAPTATAGASSASVAFTAVTGATSYTALSNPGSFTGTGASSPVTVSGLTNGTAYTFQIRANNAIGSGAYSAASNSVTPVQPTDYESIATATLSSASNSLTFSSIPGTYKHLQLRGIYRGNIDTGSLFMQFNGDTAQNYAQHFLEGWAYSSAQSVTAAGYASGIFPSAMFLHSNGGIAYGVSTSTYSAAIIDVLDYASTTKNKTARALGGTEQNNTTDSIVISSGVWLNTSAITSITIYMSNSRTLGVGTTFALYGIKG